MTREKEKEQLARKVEEEARRVTTRALEGEAMAGQIETRESKMLHPLVGRLQELQNKFFTKP